MGTGFTLLCVVLICAEHVCSFQTFTISMPDLADTRNEVYMCTSMELNQTFPDTTFSIVGFEPLVTSHIAHHAAVYGCSAPGSAERTWICGNMDDEKSGVRYPQACSGDQRTIFSWALDAESLTLPEDVGFRVGAHTNIHFIVLQFHYRLKNLTAVGQRDASGMKIRYVRKLVPLEAGVLVVTPAGTDVIPARSTVNRDMVCDLEQTRSITPIAYRTHTHGLGRVVSGWLVRRDARGEDEWTLIGKRDPLDPQAFYPVHNKVTVNPGDLMAVRCLYESERDRNTTFGYSSTDEMCVFFILYYVEDGLGPIQNTFCSSLRERQNTAWHLMGLNNIPEKQSVLL